MSVCNRSACVDSFSFLMLSGSAESDGNASVSVVLVSSSPDSIFHRQQSPCRSLCRRSMTVVSLDVPTSQWSLVSLCPSHRCHRQHHHRCRSSVSVISARCVHPLDLSPVIDFGFKQSIIIRSEGDIFYLDGAMLIRCHLDAIPAWGNIRDVCPAWGFEMDRDANAAINIL